MSSIRQRLRILGLELNNKGIFAINFVHKIIGLLNYVSTKYNRD